MASAGGGELNAIITPRAIINSVSNGNGGRRAVDCCGVLRDHIGELCLFSSSPHGPVKLFYRRSGSQLRISAEGSRKGNNSFIKTLDCFKASKKNWQEYRPSSTYSILIRIRITLFAKHTRLYKEFSLMHVGADI